LPYSVQTSDVPAYFEMKASVPEFEAMLKRQFATLYCEGETVPRVMAIAVHPVAGHTPSWEQMYSSAASSAPMRCGWLVTNVLGARAQLVGMTTRLSNAVC
jgi:hypothetical protein